MNKLPKIDRSLLSILVRGAEKTFDNAEKLYFEAESLAKIGAMARALCLHQISHEECYKVESLDVWIKSLLSGLPVDQNRALAAFGRQSAGCEPHRSGARTLLGAASIF